MGRQLIRAQQTMTFEDGQHLDGSRCATLAPTPAGFTFLLNTLAFIGHTEFRHTTV